MQKLHYPSGFAHNATRSEYLDGISSGQSALSGVKPVRLRVACEEVGRT